MEKRQIENVISKILAPFSEFPYLPKWIILLVDILISTFAFLTAYFICYDLLNQPIIPNILFFKLGLNTIVTAFFFIILQTYSGIIRHSTYRDALRIFYAVACSNITLIIINEILIIYYQKFIFPNIGFFINFTLTFLFIFSTRMFIKLLYDYVKQIANHTQKKTPLFMYGVSNANINLARMLNNSPNLPYYLVGFIATDPNAADKKLLNVPVYYEHGNLEAILSKQIAKALLINPFELERDIKQKIADKCIQYKIELLVTPPVTDWQNTATPLKEMKKIRIEDLLGRVPIEIDIHLIAKELEGKRILITGAAGSIGSEIVRQISKFKPGLLLLCDTAESPLHQLRLEVEEKHAGLNFHPIICNVRDADHLKLIFETYRPQMVYHAAAYKHVPLMEEHPSQSILTNVLGTKNVADLAIEYQAEAFIMISTDKAVNPSNVMGASKRIAEIYIQSLEKNNIAQNTPTKTRFITTRFGNVLGSNGSVIPHFKEQIEKGGPVTVTHPDIIRYFMTIPEACRLVLEAGCMGKGGEIFIFDMGESVKITEMAEKMIRLSGFIPYKDIHIKFTGLRPGEKLYEELLYDKESTKPTHNKKIMIGSVREYDCINVEENLKELIAIAQKYDEMTVVKLMKKMVPEFISSNSKYEDLDKK